MLRWREWMTSILLLIMPICSHSEMMHEIDASPYGTRDAPLPETIPTPGEKVILIDPVVHAYGAYDAKGKLIRWGLATAGADDCPDQEGDCRTKTGVFRIFSLGSVSCVSKKFPIPDGGAPMPYCMFFSGGQALHGSNEVVYDNLSHGCVRLHVEDAKWLRYHFVEAPNASNQFRGTLVVVKPYETYNSELLY